VKAQQDTVSSILVPVKAGQPGIQADPPEPRLTSPQRGDPGLALTAVDIQIHARFDEVLRRQASDLLAIQQVDPRTAAIFATQQRWLLAHLALAIHFEVEASGSIQGFPPAKIMAAAQAHGVASRNTADAFQREMLKYGYLEPVVGVRDKRLRPVRVGERALTAIVVWLRIHLASLDALDGGGRSARFDARPAAIGRIHPRIAAGLLASSAVRQPEPTFSLFTWLNEGGIMMDWLYVGLALASPDAARVATSVSAFADFQDRIRLSRTHLARKLRAAEDMNSLGWAGARGASAMWVSMSFVREYQAQQAAKLAVIDSAFCAAAAEGIV
jgi:hypothetical protein